ncbi:MAG: hypothetical protein VYC17_03710 [Nitrospinota bacterium]|nr:hypothetical protein [Nitrospinota bacterium]
MKMNHLSKEKVEEIMQKVQAALAEENFDPDKIEELFKLSEVEGEKFLDCKANPLQQDKVKFELDAEQGIRFFDPFNFFTKGIYKDVDGWSRWTSENLKEPWT